MHLDVSSPSRGPELFSILALAAVSSLCAFTLALEPGNEGIERACTTA
jgi:hypothetical protein